MTRKPTHTIWQKQDSWRLEGQWIRKPDGEQVERAFMDHPGSVVLIPLQDDNVVMIRQYRWALDATILELPAGTCEWNEDPLLCAQRELREETGYRSDKLTPLGIIWPAPGFTNEILHFYLAEALVPDPLPGDFDEDISLAPLPLADLQGMIISGELKDGKSIIGIERAIRYLSSSQ